MEVYNELVLQHDPGKKNVYVDMDGVVANYYKHSMHGNTKGAGYFLGLEVIDGALDAIAELSHHYNVYFLSTAPWSNPFAWMEKRQWLETHFGHLAFKKLILSHNKGLLKGAYLIDDRIANGVDTFEGMHIHFGEGNEFPTWGLVLDYLIPVREKDRKAQESPFTEIMDMTWAQVLNVVNGLGDGTFRFVEGTVENIRELPGSYHCVAVIMRASDGKCFKASYMGNWKHGNNITVIKEVRAKIVTKTVYQ